VHININMEESPLWLYCAERASSMQILPEFIAVTNWGLGRQVMILGKASGRRSVGGLRPVTSQGREQIVSYTSIDHGGFHGFWRAPMILANRS
jgi:hypothetical protein